MERSISRRYRPWWRAAVLALVIALVGGPTASAYTPSSPEVRDAVRRAIGFLEKGPSDDGYSDSRPGAQAVVGIALLKNGAPSRHPVVARAANHICRQIQRAQDPSGLGFDIYSTSLCVIFLVLLDKNQYAPEINSLLRYLEGKQKDHGGWGYDVRATGDTSMTQNAVLCFWEANKAKVAVAPQVVDRALIWLLKTQDPSGGFGYQGVPSPDFSPVRQADMRPSMSGAGLGSIYVCADLLNVGKAPERKKRELPPGVTEVKKEKEQRPARSRVDPGLVHQALARGKAWMEQHFEIEHAQHDYPTYNLYTVERYHTFREKVEGKAEAEPRWYNDGVR